MDGLMQSLGYFFSNTNFFFTSIGLFGAVLLASQLLGLSHGDGDVEHDISVDHDVDVSHDVGHDLADHSVDADHDVSHDADHGHDADGKGEFSLLAFVGLGLGPPSSIVFMTLFLSFGLFGLGLNRVVSSVFDVPVVYFPVNVLLAFTGSCFLLHAIIPQMAKLAPGRPMNAYQLEEGLGQVGECIMSIDHRGGEARVRIRDSVVSIDCVLADGTSAIPVGTRIVTLGFDRDRRVFTVRPLEQVIEDARTHQKGVIA